MAVAKLLLLILGGVAQMYGQTPPNVRPPTEHLREQHGLERVIPFMTWLGRALFCVWLLLEAVVLVALADLIPPTFPHHLPPKLLPQATTLTTLTPAFTVGTLFSVFGGLLRAYCYRALGAHFTFELSIRPKQALVTHGVYGVIRHPSYTGALALALGWQLRVLDRQGVVMSLVASGRDSDDGRAVMTAALTCIWATSLCMLYFGLTKRMSMEDAMLEDNFGEEWRAWAKRVPYRLVPVYMGYGLMESTVLRSTIMAIAKLLFLILGGVAQVYGQTPPNMRPPTEHLREQRGLERGFPFLIWMGRVLLCVCLLLEAVVIVALADFTPPTLAHHLSHVLLPSKLLPQATTLTTLTPVFITGTLLSVFGGLLRAHCYRALGAHFTFELSIRPKQALITHGMYGVIRHPSYTGVLVLALGWQLCMLDRQGVVMSLVAPAVGSGRNSDDGQAVVTAALTCVWATSLCMLCLVFTKRMNKEDAMLEKNFGEEWRAWAKRVPYRLVPGVY